MRGSVSNILSVWNQATEDERTRGLSWYADAHCEALSYHPDIRTSCGVIAAVSPGLRWEVNLAIAEKILTGQSFAGLGRVWTKNQGKAYAIASGESPEDVLGGNKVRAFYHNILNPHDWFNVCIDLHAFSLWIGTRFTLESIPDVTAKRYRDARADYWRAADRLGGDVIASQVQAVTWCVWRRIHATSIWRTAQQKFEFAA